MGIIDVQRIGRSLVGLPFFVKVYLRLTIERKVGRLYSIDMTKYCNACEMWELFIRKALGFFMIIVGAGGLLDSLPDFISRRVQPFVDAGFSEEVTIIILGAVPFIDLLLGVGLLIDKIRCAPTRILGVLAFVLFIVHFFWETGNYVFPLVLVLMSVVLVILQSKSRTVCSW